MKINFKGKVNIYLMVIDFLKVILLIIKQMVLALFMKIAIKSIKDFGETIKPWINI